MTRILHILPEALISRRDNITDYDTHFVLVVRLFVFPFAVSRFDFDVAFSFVYAYESSSASESAVHTRRLPLGDEGTASHQQWQQKHAFDQPTEDASVNLAVCEAPAAPA